MTHVQIKLDAYDADASSIKVDGFELAGCIMATGFRIVHPEPGHPGEVHMVVAADVLEIDLPHSVVVALRESEPEQ